MMNRYRNGYDRMGGRSPRYGDVSPYRRAPIRDDVAQRSFNRPGGCGCGLGNSYRQAHQAEEAPSRRSEGIPACGQSCASPLPARERSACGCEGAGASLHGRKLMEQIRAVDFALYETVLYLDAYPHSCDALETYRKLCAQSEALHAEYEATNGPLTVFGDKGNSWNWMSKPFPWEYDAD